MVANPTPNINHYLFLAKNTNKFHSKHTIFFQQEVRPSSSFFYIILEVLSFLPSFLIINQQGPSFITLPFPSSYSNYSKDGPAML